jgi:diguanylate cyclase (GGDEF)-like protein
VTVPRPESHSTAETEETPPGVTHPGPSTFRAGIGVLNARFLRLVDATIPGGMCSDPDTLRRARIILSFTLVLIILALESWVFFAWVLPQAETQRVSLALVVALLLTLSIPVVFRRSGSLALSANLVITAAYIVTVAIYSVIGGIKAPLIHWLALLPMLAALMGARTSAWIWTAISFSTVVFFIVADAANWNIIDVIGFSSLEGPALWIQRLVNVASWLGILLAVALLYEDHKNLQTSRLAEKNDELQSQVEQRNQAEQRSQYLAYYDELTGLPNRRLFLEQLSTAIEQIPRLNRSIGLLFLDLDRFKEVNDMHGHELGDQLLRQVAERLHNCVRQSDRVSHSPTEDMANVARLGGDEFTILLHGIHGHHDAAIVAQRILDSLRHSFVLGELEIFIGTSIGIALFSDNGMDAGDLLRNADLAMYQAKSAGKNNFKFHEESMNADIVMRNTMTDALRKALEDKKLELHYQPIVDAHTRAITRVEGLVRWKPVGQDNVPTETLIQIAEDSGLIIQLGNWVINEACRQYREWQEAGIDLRRIAVNVSAEQFRRSSVVHIVKDALHQFNMDPGSLEIEITEGAMMVDEDRTLGTLMELKRLGVKISLDDFGTGYSSLSYVHRFPVDTLKIDRSFVMDVEINQGSRAIAMAVIALAHQLELKVVGEGVENSSQENFLLENGCDEMQGYLYCKPLPAKEVEHVLLNGIPL